MKSATAATLLAAVSAASAMHIPRSANPDLFDSISNFVEEEISTVESEALVYFGMDKTEAFPLLSPEAAESQLSAAKGKIEDAFKGMFDDTVKTSPDSAPAPEGAAQNKVATGGSGNAQQKATAACTNPKVRREWRTMSSADQNNFLKAVVCLTKVPSQLPASSHSTSRFTDLQSIHRQMSAQIHNVGQFLPWHRYFLMAFENELKTKCGYPGTIPWWDETKDAGHFAQSPLFTANAFGSVHAGSPQCVTNGAFAGLQLQIGPGGSNTKRCLGRGIDENLSKAITTSFVNTCNSHTGFADMENCVYPGPHGYGHDAVGGVMSDVSSSPGDPIFYLHHGFIDRNWNTWQRTGSNRIYAIGGVTTQGGTQPTTLNTPLSIPGFMPDTTVGAVMDTQSSNLCYVYA